MIDSIPLGLLIDVVYLVTAENMEQAERDRFDSELDDDGSSVVSDAALKREYLRRFGEQK